MDQVTINVKERTSSTECLLDAVKMSNVHVPLKSNKQWLVCGSFKIHV